MEKSKLTQKNYACVYNETTKPKKPKRRDKSDLGPDFVAPDGGWGWVICLAAGLNNFFMFPALQQFGLIYRERMSLLGFNAKDTTIIVNLVMTLSSIVGIFNGAMFRRFSFRQVAIAGTTLGFVGIFASAFCTTVWQYILTLSLIYGVGLGMAMAAVSLAVNTYFKKSRRRATGFSWTITGLGPIVFPYVSTFLLELYGAQGSILIYSGVTLNALLCALTLQPVMRHVRNKVPSDPNDNGNGNANGNKNENENENENEQKEQTEQLEANGNLLTPVGNDPWCDYECKYCQCQKRSKRGIFTSQYLFNDDDPEHPGYEITDPGTPMLARANDGWFGSKLSLASDRRQVLLRQASVTVSVANAKGSRDNLDKLEEASEPTIDQRRQSVVALTKPNYFNREREDQHGHYASKTSIYSKPGCGSGCGGDELLHCTCAEDKALLQKSAEVLRLQQLALHAAQEAEEEEKRKMSFRQKVSKFFDLDLLRNFTFVNLVIGMSIMMFGEMNFSVLTPFILNSYGYTDTQCSLVMSLLACMDISVRFLAPLCLEKVEWDNRVLFAFGIVCIAVGRVIVTMTRSFEIVVAIFLLIGFGKGFRTIFSPLIIPSFVPLRRLPAASGLQLIFNTIFSFAMGPVLGIITEAFGYSATIHTINLLTAIALLLWLTESIVRRAIGKPYNPPDY